MVTKAPINKEENDMTLKKFGALLLAGAMMTGTLGVMSPTQAKAATPANTYTMTVRQTWISRIPDGIHLVISR